jgi:hypothetical protein
MNRMEIDPNRREQRTIMVFLRDRERDIGTAVKTKGDWVGGRFDPTPWSAGEYRCDSVRGRLLYVGGEYAPGISRFVVERILLWDTGEFVYSETGER